MSAQPAPDDTSLLAQRKAKAHAWFEALQADIIARFETLEDEASPPL
jgi:coproporphyrinogen III oxidase